jgi:predicted PurR-regulated permease PerM
MSAVPAKAGPLLPPASAASMLVVAVVAVAALYFAREVLVPIALAILLSFVLAPFVRLLQGWHIPRIVTVISIAVVAFASIAAISGIMLMQVNRLAEELPRYQSTLREKIQTLRGATTGRGTLSRAADVIQELGAELERALPGTTGKRSTAPPTVVEIRQPDPGAMQTVALLIKPLIGPLATVGIVFLFVVFILMQREDLRNRLIRLGGIGDIQRTTSAMDDAGRRLSRLFLTQLALNAAFGTVIGLGLTVIGVPSAPLWGIFAMILRFVPYIGALLAAVFPLLLATAAGPGWAMVLWTALLFAIVEPLIGHVVEPLVLGRSSGLSPAAVVVSATFWTWLWGPIGLVLATPLTICLVVVGRHVDRLKFLDVMFGDEPVLSPAELVYQRMLASDSAEAVDQAELFLKDKSIIEFYEDVLLESLQLAHRDATSGELDDERLQRVRAAATEIIDDLGTYEEKPGLALPALTASAGPEPGKAAVLCIPGHGPFDEILASIIAQLAARRGLAARAESANALSMTRTEPLEIESVQCACLCFVGGGKPAQVRYALRRLRRKLQDVAIVLVLPGTEATSESELQVEQHHDVFLARSLEAAVEQMVVKLQFAAPSPAPS